MAAGSTLVASKHSITAPFFLVKRKVAYFSKAYAARFYTGGVRPFCVVLRAAQKFFHALIYRPVNQANRR